MNKQTKKLTLNKETLRDLTTHTAGEVKGGDKRTVVTCTCISCHKVCFFTIGCPNGKTYNRQCGH